MRAIIPVAGQGTRLRPHTHTTPKVLLHVAGKPMLGHILDELVAIGVRQATFVVGYMGEMIRAFVETNYPPLHAQYVEQQELLGLGHAIWLARTTASGPDEPVLIILGDTLFDANLRKVLRSKVSMIGVKAVDDPRRFGIVELKGGFIRHLVEKPKKPKTNLAIVGIYYIVRSGLLFDCLDTIIARGHRTAGEFQLTDALEKMLERGEKMRIFTVEGWYDCGKPETLLETNRILLEIKHRDSASEYAPRFPSSIINAPVYIAPTAVVENSIVGPYVAVADGSVIRNSIVTNSILSTHAFVQNMILTESIVSDRAKIEGESYRLNVGDSSEISFGRSLSRAEK
jgi:glucose-1-phosphate thymidylyltransferase